MKRILLAILVAIPSLLMAQTEKYMVGAVPEQDGKVVFKRELNVSNFSQKQIFDAIHGWAATKYSGQNNKLLYVNEDHGNLAVQGVEEMMIRIGLFPGKVKMHYTLSFVCKEGKCDLKTTRVRYTNNPACKDANEVLTAEEYITDKYALNKSKTKIFKGTGDYRIKTIDIVDKLAQEAQEAVILANSTMVTISAADATDATPANAVEISDEIKNAVATGGLSVVSAGGRQLSRPVAGKATLNVTPEKVSVMFTLEQDTDNIMFVMEMAENFTLALMDQVNDKPTVLFNCKKSQQFGKTFIGEIITVKKP